VKNVYDYLISRYGHKDYQPNLYMMIDELCVRVKTLEDKYSEALHDIKRLEEENVETTNQLYRLENSLDARIDILAEHCRISEDV
jgi:peptidoglycan hydrolase CwlO-like protein